MVRWASSSTVPARCMGIWSACVAPTALLSVGLSISQAYSVGIGPGATAFRRIPYRAHSAASDIVIACTAALAMADGTTVVDHSGQRAVSGPDLVHGLIYLVGVADIDGLDVHRPRPRPVPPPVMRIRLPARRSGE